MKLTYEMGYAQGRLDEFVRMKKERPLDPVYWDAHEERDLLEAATKSRPVEYPSSPPIGVVHERVDAIATFDSVAQGPSSPQVTPPKYDPSWHGSQAHTFVTDKPVGSEVKPRTGDKS